MNILDLLDTELKQLGKNWLLQEKARYIYLRSCELFTYDSRYPWCEMDLVYNAKALERKIKYSKFDLKNIKDFQVICFTWSEEIFSNLLKQLLDLENNIKGSGHKYIVFNNGKFDLSADATLSNDLTRVKMKLNTLGYKPVTKKYGFNEQLKFIDQTLGYIKSEYKNDSIEKLSLDLAMRFLESYKTCIDKNRLEDELLIEKLYTIKELYESYSNLQFFFDCKFCINYLLQKFLNDNELNKVNICELFINENEYWDFLNIYKVQLFQDTIYFVLEKGSVGYNFYEIPYSDVKNICNNYNGINKSHLIK